MAKRRSRSNRRRQAIIRRAEKGMLPRARKLVKVSEGGRVTLPKEFREALGLHKGDLLYAVVEGKDVVFSIARIPRLGRPASRRAYDEAIRTMEEARIDSL